MAKTVTINGVVSSDPAVITGIVNKIDRAIEVSSDIPADAKSAVKNFIHENIQALTEQIENLDNLSVPENIAEWWPQAVEILKNVLLGVSSRIDTAKRAVEENEKLA